MKTPSGKAKPHGGRKVTSRVDGNYRRATTELDSGPKRAPRLPRDWRARLPNPSRYYGHRIAELSSPNAIGWAQEQCPFHEDKNASLAIQVDGERGGWRCVAGCGGADLVGFHMRLTGKAFAEAVADLLRGTP